MMQQILIRQVNIASVPNRLKKPSIKNKIFIDISKKIWKMKRLVSLNNIRKVIDMICEKSHTTSGQRDGFQDSEKEKYHEEQKVSEQVSSKKKEQIEYGNKQKDSHTQEIRKSDGLNDEQSQFIKQGLNKDDTKFKQTLKLEINQQNSVLKQIFEQTIDSKLEQFNAKNQIILKSILKGILHINGKVNFIESQYQQTKRTVQLNREHNSLTKDDIENIMKRSLQENNIKIQELVDNKSREIQIKLNQQKEFFTNKLLQQIKVITSQINTQNKQSFEILSQLLQFQKQDLIRENKDRHENILSLVNLKETRIIKKFEETKKQIETKLNEFVQNYPNNFIIDVLKNVATSFKDFMNKKSLVKELNCFNNKASNQNNLANLSTISFFLKNFNKNNTNFNNVLQKKLYKSNEDIDQLGHENIFDNINQLVNYTIKDVTSEKKQISINEQSCMLNCNYEYINNSKISSNNINEFFQDIKDKSVQQEIPFEIHNLSQINHRKVDSDVSICERKLLDKIQQIQNKRQNNHQNIEKYVIVMKNIFAAKKDPNNLIRRNRFFYNASIRFNHVQQQSFEQEFMKSRGKRNYNIKNKLFTNHEKQQLSNQKHFPVINKTNNNDQLLNYHQTQHFPNCPQNSYKSAQNSYFQFSHKNEQTNKTILSQEVQNFNKNEREIQQVNHKPFQLVESMVRKYQSSDKPLNELFDKNNMRPQYNKYLKIYDHLKEICYDDKCLSCQQNQLSRQVQNLLVINNRNKNVSQSKKPPSSDIQSSHEISLIYPLKILFDQNKPDDLRQAQCSVQQNTETIKQPNLQDYQNKSDLIYNDIDEHNESNKNILDQSQFTIDDCLQPNQVQINLQEHYQIGNINVEKTPQQKVEKQPA